MKIGIDARFYGPGGKGLGRYTQKLIEYLEAIDDTNEYVVFLRRENFAAYVPRQPNFQKALAEYRWYGLGEQLWYPLLLCRHAFDLMHFPHFNVPLFYRRPFVVTIHDLILLRYPTARNTTRSLPLYRLKYLAYRTVIASAIRRARRIITVSRFTERDILAHYPESAGKIRVTYEATEAPTAVSEPEREQELLERLRLTTSEGETVAGVGGRYARIRLYCLYVGNAYPHKNLDRLLAAAKRLTDLRFVLVGKEDYFFRRLMAEARRQAIANVIFAGYVEDRDLGTLYRNATLYLFPSLYEGFGLPPLEAMAYGLPVIASSLGSLPEILGEAAQYVDPREEGSLERAIGSLLADVTARERLRERGFRRIAQYSWKRMAQQTLDVYRQAVSNS